MILRRSFQASVARRFACSTCPPCPPCPVDLRSDTVTLPCPGMREAMATARLGDDVFQEDPTTRELEVGPAGACSCSNAAVLLQYCCSSAAVVVQ